MSDTPNTDRERFEQFHGQRRSKGAGWRERVFDRLPDGTYADDSVQRHWWTWQNALEAQAAELARLRAERVTGMDAFVLRLLVAAGHVTQAKVDEAFSIAEKAPQPPAQPAPPSAVERDAVRLDWLMRHVPGRALRPLIGVMAWSGDIDEFRAAIDAAAGKGEAQLPAVPAQEG